VIDLDRRKETKGVEEVDVVVFVEGDPPFVCLPAYSAIIFFLVKQKT
jgi:hypothetical protein